MGRGYKFHNPEGIYFVSFTVVKWLKVFTEEKYINILLDSLRFCQNKKGMEIYSWVIMPNHVHLVFRSIGEQSPDFLLGDYKRFTSNSILNYMIKNREEGNNDYFLKVFKKAGDKTGNVNHHQFWQHHNHPIELWSKKVTNQKVNYIHNNPVKSGLVENPEDYLYSSAKDYYGGNGILEGVVLL